MTILNSDVTKNLADNLECFPKIFDLNTKTDKDELEKIISEKGVLKIVDTYASQRKELDEVNDPTILTRPPNPEKSEQVFTENDGVWAYFPWNKTLVHILAESDFVKLRTSRNAFLINEKEQKTLANARIGIVGLNVGNPGAVCVAHEGGRNMKFADFDELSLSNLNRFNAGISELGVNKAVLTARQVFEIDPFSHIEIFKDGIKPETVEKFLTDPKIDLLIEEMDNLKLKVFIRQFAKKHRIPVLMVTADGVVDVERYDLDEDLEILAGNLSQDVMNRIDQVVPGKTTLKERAFIAKDFIGGELHSERLNKAFEAIGETLPSIPQLSEWTFLRGALLGHFARKILTGEKIVSGRYKFSLEDFTGKK